MAASKSLKQCQAWFWINYNQNLKPNWSQMKCNVWKPCSEQPWQDKLHFSIWGFFEQSALVNIHLLCSWPTIYNLISKICPKFQVLNSCIFKIDVLLNEHWAKIVQSENISTPIYVECYNIYRWKVFVFKNSSISCLALIFNLNNQRLTVLYAKKIGCRWLNMKCQILFFSSSWYNPKA